MKTLIMLIALSFLLSAAHAQSVIKDNAILHQEQRMVFQQWNQNQFDPKSGFLSLNPYYWLVWGLFYPDYHKTDLRPLSTTGPQTQRIALVGLQNSTDNSYKLHSDTVKNTALSQVATQSDLLSDGDPLWLLYYKSEFNPLINYTPTTILGNLTPQVSTALVKDGLYTWYTNELDRLKERLQGARSTTMDRGSRIMAYYRLLQEYKNLNAVWSVRTASAQSTLDLTKQQLNLKQGTLTIPNWTPHSDVDIANRILQNRKY